MRHDNFCDRLISRMTCGSKRKEPSIPDGVQIDGDQACRRGRRRPACGPQAWDIAPLHDRTKASKAHGPEGLNRKPGPSLGPRKLKPLPAADQKRSALAQANARIAELE